MASGVLPPQVAHDAAHIAVAAVHAVDYLLTWNCKHLANIAENSIGVREGRASNADHLYA